VTRIRHADELVGLFVLLAVLVLVGAILEAGFLGRWFQPTSTLRVLLPESGVGGLEAGAEVEVLGTHAGTVRRIVIKPGKKMYAVAEIDDQVRAMIPRDSRAVIRRRYGIAGAGFVDIQRGVGAPMDWHYAVIAATTERPPTDSITALIDETRGKIFPVLTDAGRVARSVAAIAERTERGEGDVGHLLTDETLARNADSVAASANEDMKILGRLLARLDEDSANVGALVRAARDGKTGLPALLRQADQILGDVHGATRDLGRAMARAPTIARNLEATSGTMPVLLVQIQATADQLERLLIQLRGNWLLGGATIEPKARRLAPTQARP
jgi:phospholipid/cholesterol/gamma-HCH transport system substrate-binding protein